MIGVAGAWLVLFALSFHRPAWLFDLAESIGLGSELTLAGVVTAVCIAVLGIFGMRWLTAPNRDIDPNSGDGRRLRRTTRVAAAAALLMLVIAATLAASGPGWTQWDAEMQLRMLGDTDDDAADGTTADDTDTGGVPATAQRDRRLTGAQAGHPAGNRPDVCRGSPPRWRDRLACLVAFDHDQGRAARWHWLWLCAALAAAAALAGLAVRINRFSMHELYRTRIARTFLGASRTDPDVGPRRPDPLTGFDPADDLPIDRLQGLRPLLVVNAALNLSAGQRLDWQERKAATFSITPYHVSSALAPIGFRRAERYGGEPSRRARVTAGRGMGLASAVAVSGAATSPNMGHGSNPLAAFVLTALNLRLGLWLGNPMSSRARRWLAEQRRRSPEPPARRADLAGSPDWLHVARDRHPAFAARLRDRRYHAWCRSDPASSTGPLLREMTGGSDDSGTWINVTDGGHFDNLGLYEMLLRRCRVIVCVDATNDPQRDLHHFARLARLASVDLGVELTPFDGGVRIEAPAPAVPLLAYRIVYPASMAGRDPSTDEEPADAPVARDGVLLLLKPALTGTEPIDVAQYARSHPAFPHESTQDQFFGETQFESYRRLGRHLADTLLQMGQAPFAGQAWACDLVARVTARRD